MTQHDESVSSRRDGRAVAWALGLATLLGLIESVKGWVAGRNAPNDFGWTEALLANLPWWLLWGLLAVVIFALVRRFPLEREAWPRSLFVHVGASVLFSALHLGISALIVWTAVSHSFFTLQEQSRQFLVGFLLTDVVTYWAIAAAFSVRVSRRRLEHSRREQELLQVHNARLESEMSRARLEALRRELNPHFLFNTLNSVSALARRGDGDRAAVALARLSELLRRVLDDALEEQISVEEEIALLRLYLDIVDLRYGDRLDVDVRVDPDARRALVPSLVLQPLAENAVKHGVEAMRGRARLQIRVTSREGRLDLSVRNSGPASPGAAITVVDPDAPQGTGVGLRNTRDRLRTLYGEAAALTLRPVPSGGAEARISLPLVVEEEVRLGA
jgi:sensor histidine kinase YesM